MKKLVTKLRKGPVPNPSVQEKKPDSPESMGSLFAEAGDEYLSDEEQDAKQEPDTLAPVGRPAVTPQTVGGNFLKPKAKKPRI